MVTSRPDSDIDYILLGFGIATAIPFTIANGVLFVHRQRSYFHAQGGVYFILASSLAGLAWIATVFVNNEHFSRVGPLQSCKLWLFWLQGFSFGFWFMLTAFRLRRMYELSHNIKRWRWEYYAFAAISLLPVVGMSTAAIFSNFNVEHGGINRNWQIVRLSAYLPYWLFAAAVMWRLQRQQDPLLAAEYMDTFDYLALVIAIAVIYVFSYLTSVCLVFFPFWTRFAWPVYLCLLRPKEEMDAFEQQLSSAGARALLISQSQRVHFPSSEGAVWEAFAEANEELEKYKHEIQKLQAQKLRLQEKIRDLRDQAKQQQGCYMEVVPSRPNTPYDFTLLAFALAATVPFIVANGALFAHRGRSYFRAQGGVYLILGSSLAGLVWIAAQFVNNDHFSRVGPLRSCVLWTFWLQGTGICLWFVLTVLRLARMYELSKNIDNWSWKYYAFVAFCLLPIVILSTVAGFSDFDGHERSKPACNPSKHWKIIVRSVYTPYWLLLIFFIYKLRKQEDPLLATEYRDTLDYLAMAIVIVMLSAVAVVTKASDTIPGRCFLTFSTCCLVFFHFWIRFGWPIYLCLFRPKEEMDNFEQELTYGGARALDMVYSQRIHFPSSEGAIWEAFSKASDDLDRYKDEIRKLEVQKALLEGKIRELHVQKRKAAESAPQGKFQGDCQVLGRKRQLMDRTDTVYDYVLLGFALGAAVPFIIANGVLFVHRNRSYFRAQGGVYLVLCSSLAGLVWISSSFLNDGHFQHTGPFISGVRWAFWLQGLGVCSWFMLTVLRLRRMYELSRNIHKWSWGNYALLLASMLPVLVLFVAANLKREREHHGTLDSARVLTVLAVYTPNLLLVIVFMYKLRNQQDPLLTVEYAHTCEYLTMAVAICFLAAIAVFTGDSESIAGRCFLTFCVCCLVFFHFWIRFGWPVYLCLWRPAEDMDKFEEELTSAGARALAVVPNQMLHFPSSEGAIWEAFFKASEELESYKVKDKYSSLI
ncbi:hypothetical protein SELMODRAFT_406059 [Selaginella moellendorffii]|uniref:Uncharacterized protein n=1 Tax=Selaginella moellendorffii TaxID=88036 RepID=D8R0J3_SELML|nr:hypothetical protein SELMODRAFT_406059 [Selaginella moellendorffii]